MRKADLTKAACSDEVFIDLFKRYGAHETATRLGVILRNVQRRRRNIEQRLGQELNSPNRYANQIVAGEHPHRIKVRIRDGVIVVGSDAHYWPGPPSTAHRAFVKFCKELAPRAVIMNGDVMDCATISRHAPIGWEKRPGVIQEIEVAQERLHDIAMA